MSVLWVERDRNKVREIERERVRTKQMKPNTARGSVNSCIHCFWDETERLADVKSSSSRYHKNCLEPAVVVMEAVALNGSI